MDERLGVRFVVALGFLASEIVKQEFDEYRSARAFALDARYQGEDSIAISRRETVPLDLGGIVTTHTTVDYLFLMTRGVVSRDVRP